MAKKDPAIVFLIMIFGFMAIDSVVTSVASSYTINDNLFVNGSLNVTGNASIGEDLFVYGGAVFSGETPTEETLGYDNVRIGVFSNTPRLIFDDDVNTSQIDYVGNHLRFIIQINETGTTHRAIMRINTTGVRIGEKLHNADLFVVGDVSIGGDLFVDDAIIGGSYGLIQSSSPLLKLTDTDSPGYGGYGLVKAWYSANRMGLDIDPFTAEDDDESYFRYFRNVDTSAPVYFNVMSGEGSNTINAQVAGKGRDTYFCALDGEFGIRTTAPAYPLEVRGNVSGITVWSEANISAAGYITRTSIYEPKPGKEPKDFIKDASYYVKPDGSIDHSKFYGSVSYDAVDWGKTTWKNVTYEICDDEGCIEETTREVDEYRYKKEQGVDLGMEIDVLRQEVYNLRQELEALKK